MYDPKMTSLRQLAVVHDPESPTLVLSLGVNPLSSRFLFRMYLRGSLECPQYKYPIKEEHSQLLCHTFLLEKQINLKINLLGIGLTQGINVGS